MNKNKKLLTTGQSATLHGINKKSLCGMTSLPDEKIKDLNHSIMHLQAVRKTLCNHHQNMVTLLTMDLSKIRIGEKEERCLIAVDTGENTTFEQKVEMITYKTTEYQLGRLHNASYSSMMPVKSLQESNFIDYTNLFVEIPFLKLIPQR